MFWNWLQKIADGHYTTYAQFLADLRGLLHKSIVIHGGKYTFQHLARELFFLRVFLMIDETVFPDFYQWSCTINKAIKNSLPLAEKTSSDTMAYISDKKRD